MLQSNIGLQQQTSEPEEYIQDETSLLEDAYRGPESLLIQKNMTAMQPGQEKTLVSRSNEEIYEESDGPVHF